MKCTLQSMPERWAFKSDDLTDLNSHSYVFGSAGVINQTGGWNTGIAFLFGLLSVQWTMTDYDATGEPFGVLVTVPLTLLQTSSHLVCQTKPA